ncbi:hypothetical protein R6Q59_025945 [Mikania micrantha]
MVTVTTIVGNSPVIHTQISSKFLISNLNYKRNSIRIHCSSSSSPEPLTAHETLAPPVTHSVNDTATQKWEAHRKRKVVMRVGYVGIDYRAIEKELELAIYKAGGIRDSNFGDLQKIAWATSSQIDDEVHSLSTMISFKMEIPENAWIDDHNGTTLSDIVNTYLPKNIKVFSILPSQKSFNAAEECNMRKYVYLLPLEVIGICTNSSETEIEHHLSEFNDILNFFEGKHPFHNYAIISKYRNQYPEEQSHDNGTDESVEEHMPISFKESDRKSVDEDYMPLRCNDFDRKLVDESDANRSSLKEPLIIAKWLHQPDKNDRITDAHFRKIFQCSCGKMKTLLGTSYVEISICGESFMLHQIQKMVGTAVAVKRGLIPRDIIPLSLNKFTRFNLPIAPSEVLFLRWNHFILEKESGKYVRPEILTSVESEEILKNVEDFYESIMLPWFPEFLDHLKHPWNEWVELLDANARIPDSQLDEIRNAWITWEENFWVKTDAALYYSS